MVDPEKAEILARAGFAYDANRLVFTKHTVPRKVLALLWIVDRPPAELRAAIEASGDGPEFYFNDPVAEDQRAALARRYGWVK